jgi:hypothetical protein
MSCSNSATIQSGTFITGVASNGVISIPVSVSSGSGNVAVSVSGGGFTNNGTFNQVVNTSTTSLSVPVTYNGSGTASTRFVVFEITGGDEPSIECTFQIPVVCPPCELRVSEVIINNVTNTGFDVIVDGLTNNVSCIDSYDIVITNTSNGSIASSATNQVASPFTFNSGVINTNYTVSVIKNCCCGNDSAAIIKNQSTANQPTVIMETHTLHDANPGDRIFNIDFNSGSTFVQFALSAPGFSLQAGVPYLIGSNIINFSIDKVSAPDLTVSFRDGNGLILASMTISSSGSYSLPVTLTGTEPQLLQLRLA